MRPGWKRLSQKYFDTTFAELYVSSWHNCVKSSSRAEAGRENYEIQGLGPFYAQMDTHSEYTHHV